jgi:peptidyl-prolyl cis-trans isomerase D
MATLEKIRSKGALLVIVIGLALLAFIIGDFLNSSSSFFNQSREKIAVVGDEDINIHEFSAAVDQMTEVYKIETGQTDLNEQVLSQLRASVWENMVNEKILYAEAQKLGLTVSADELSDRLIGKNIHPLILQRRVFMDQNGQFSRTLLVQFLNSLDATPTNSEMKQQIDQAKNYWMFWEHNVKNTILQEKYNKLITSAITANSVDAKINFQARKITVDAAYVMQPYYSLPDSMFSVSDKEIADRYNKQKDLYKQDKSSSISYVAFEIKPSQEDYKEAEQWINRIADEFRTTDDVVGLVNTNSDVMYDGSYYSEKTVPAQLKDFAFSGKKNDVFGPVFQNDTYTMARIMETGILRPDSVKLRHIYLTKENEVKADSLVKAIKAGADFAALAKKYSAVPQTAANGGEIGWIPDGAKGVDTQILENAFSKPVNEVFTIKDAQGTQIMQVTQKTTPRRMVKLAILEIKVTASSKTFSQVYNDAKQFSADLTAENFVKNAQQKGYIVQQAEDLNENAEQVNGLPQSRQIVRWAAKGEKGDVSDVFECGNYYVVAMITEKNEKGYRPLEKVSAQVKSEIIKEKKADQMIKKLSAQLKQTPTLESVAPVLGTEVKLAEAVNFASYQFGLAGFEPYIIGKATVVPLEKVAGPYKGNAGVYVIRTTNKRESAEPFNVKMEIMQLNARTLYSLPYLILEDMRNKTEIQDNRSNFY